MVNQNTNFFQIVNNFEKTKHIASVSIVRSNLNFDPEIAIVIPTFKRSELLKFTIESALTQQEYYNYEIIIVDNDPERNCATEKMVKTFSDERISYYKNSENLGMVDNWNRCLELTKCQWVVLLHDDDLILPNFIKECMDIVTKYPDIGILKPVQYTWHYDGSELKLPSIKQTKKLKRVYEIDHLERNIIGPPSGLMFAKDKVYLIGGFNAEMYPTADLCLTVLLSYYFKVYQTDQVLSVYRWMENESLKVKTLQGFIVNDYYLLSFLCTRFNFPKILSRNMINFKFRDSEWSFKKINKEFHFDNKLLGIKRVNIITGKISYHLNHFVILSYRAIYSLFGRLIFKKRQSTLLRLSPH